MLLSNNILVFGYDSFFFGFYSTMFCCQLEMSANFLVVFGSIIWLCIFEVVKIWQGLKKLSKVTNFHKRILSLVQKNRSMDEYSSKVKPVCGVGYGRGSKWEIAPLNRYILPLCLPSGIKAKTFSFSLVFSFSLTSFAFFCFWSVKFEIFPQESLLPLEKWSCYEPGLN